MKILFSQQEIETKCEELGREISSFYSDVPSLTAVALMNGAMMFASRLVQHISIPLYLDSFSASSYVNDASSGQLVIRCGTKKSVKGRHVLLIDDIIDKGFSMQKTIEYFREQGALSIRTCVLLDKETCRCDGGLEKTDWYGFRIPDLYVIGYGLDSQELYRNLPYVAVIE